MLSLGVRSNLAYNGGLTNISLCGIAGGTVKDATTGAEVFAQGIANEILALFYDNDVLTEMTVDCTIFGSSTLNPPIFNITHWEQRSVGSVDITWQLTCNGKTASWVYSSTATMDGVLICGSGSYWSQDQEESLTDGSTVFQTYSATTSGSNYITIPPVMPNAAINSTTYIFTNHGACRSAGDLWLDGFRVFGGGFFSMEFIRYAYNVIGVLSRGDVFLRGPALAPSGKIAASSIGSGYYGAYNARTGDAVAGEETTVSYV